MWKSFFFAVLAITLPLLSARADVGRLQIDVSGRAPARYVTYANFDSFRPVQTAEQVALLASAPSDSNTAKLSKDLSGSRIFEASIIQVLETPGKKVLSWDVLFRRLYVNCDDRSLYLFSTERIHRSENADEDTFTLVSEGRMLDGKERWQGVIAEHVCNQQPWRERAARVSYSGGAPNKAGSYTLTCRERAMAELGLECNYSSDYESLRISASYAMQDPALAAAREPEE